MNELINYFSSGVPAIILVVTFFVLLNKFLQFHNQDHNDDR